MKPIKEHAKELYSNWTLVLKLWRTENIMDEIKILAFIPALVLTPVSLCICTMYLIMYYAMYVLILVPLAWIIWFGYRLTKKKRIHKNKYTL